MLSLPGEHTKLFQHTGDRTPETDTVAEELARATMLHAWPTMGEIVLTWTRHHQPDTWLLFATGIEES